jgi:hypothetical protein
VRKSRRTLKKESSSAQEGRKKKEERKQKKQNGVSFFLRFYGHPIFKFGITSGRSW